MMFRLKYVRLVFHYFWNVLIYNKKIYSSQILDHEVISNHSAYFILNSLLASYPFFK